MIYYTCGTAFVEMKSPSNGTALVRSSCIDSCRYLKTKPITPPMKRQDDY